MANPPGGQSAPSAEGAAPLADLTPLMRESPPWLVSAVVHMLAMILLGLWLAKNDERPKLVLDASYAEDFGDLPVNLDVPQDNLDDQDVVITPETLPVVVEPLATPTVDIVTPTPIVPTGTLAPTSIGLALTGREPGMREAMLRAGGGDGQTEAAVALGLQWLARQQRGDGLWSLRGPYANGSGTENVEAATAMALLAFQGAGYTTHSDPEHPFTRVVQKAWAALIKRLEPDGRFFHDVPESHQLYTQAQCTIALCELYGMTKDPKYFDPAQRAVDYCVRVQSPLGGWRYQPGENGDMSVTGWFVMALQSARMAGIEVPSPVFDKIGEFLDLVSHEGGARYAYQYRVSGPTLSLTAEGLLCRQYLGWTRDDPRLNLGVSYLLANPPNWDRRNVYYWYYATQVLHHMEGEPWRAWNAVMKSLLTQQQIATGRDRGSWDPRGDRWGESSGGRLYVTCLSIYMLEVYYRHMPLYQSGLLDGPQR
jgi:hypothetical protein